MCVRYLRSENASTVEWTTHALSTGSLLALQLLNNVTLNGIDKDGGYSGGSGIYPTKYLRMCIHKHAAEVSFRISLNGFSRLNTGAHAYIFFLLVP